MRNALIGALVGIARATEGNEYLITNEITLFLARALHLSAGETTWQLLLQEAEQIKHSLVPNCFFCDNPCGRTENYDLAELENEPEAVVAVKRQILSLSQKLGAEFQIEDTPLLYDALVMLGLTVDTTEYLLPTLHKLQLRVQ